LGLTKDTFSVICFSPVRCCGDVSDSYYIIVVYFLGLYNCLIFRFSIQTFPLLGVNRVYIGVVIIANVPGEPLLPKSTFMDGR